MRQRITYILPQGINVDPSEIVVRKTEVQYAKAAHAAQERRYTFALSELPEEIQDFLNDFHELHVRVASFQPTQLFSPAVSRVPPGLHAFFTPRKTDAKLDLCPRIKRFLGGGVKCGVGLESFSKPPILSERFASASTYQFYDGSVDTIAVSSLWNLHLCSGLSGASPRRTLCDILSATSMAAYVDYDFDVISHAVTVTMLLEAHDAQYGDLGVAKVDVDDRVEVGILSPEKADEPEELKLGGFLTVIGEDDHPGPTMFSFPARHHPLPASHKLTYSVKFQQPTGLHPKVQIAIPRQNLQPPKDSCALHAYWTLPSTLFIDRYQLEDPLFLASQNLVSLRSLSGEQDLEAPDWVVKQWGSAALIELAHPNVTSPAEARRDWKITIPTHLRYVKPSLPGSHATVSIPWPVIFWACEAEEGLKMATNPFDRVNLGYDGLFGPKTMFYHVPPKGASGQQLIETLNVPVLDVSQSWLVSVATMMVVLVGFGWVCAKLWRAATATSTRGDTKKKAA